MPMYGGVWYSAADKGDEMTKPDVKSIFDIAPDAAREAQLDALAEAEIDAGKGIPNDKVRAWLLRLAKGEKVPPPTA